MELGLENPGNKSRLIKVVVVVVVVAVDALAVAVDALAVVVVVGSTTVTNNARSSGGTPACQ